MTTHLMQARSSTDGLLKSWLATSADFAAVGFPGPGSAQHVAVAKRLVKLTADDEATYNALDYGLDGTASGDAAAITAAVAAAAAAGGGVVLIPAGSWPFNNVSITSKHNVRLRGSGRGLTKLIPAQTGAARIGVTTSDHFSVEDLTIEATSVGGFGLGAFVSFTSCAYPKAKNLELAYSGSEAVLFDRCSDYEADDVLVRRHVAGGAQAAVRTVGTPSVPCIRGKLNNVRFRNPYLRAVGSSLTPKTWAATTGGFAVGDVVFISANDWVFEVSATSTGTTGSTAPAPPTGVAGETFFTTNISDGGVTWRPVCANCRVIVPDSDTIDLEITNCNVEGGRDSFRSTNSVGGGTVPRDVRVRGLKTFRAHNSSVILERGTDFSFEDCHVDYSISQHGFRIDSTFTSEAWFFDCRSRNNWNDGWNTTAGPVEVHLRNPHARNNSRAGSTTSSGIVFGNSCGEFSVEGGLSQGTNQAYGVSIGTGCSSFMVQDNDLGGNVTGPLLNGSATTASSQRVRHNRADSSDRKAVYLTGQTASIGTTTLLTAPAKGLYQVRTYLATTTVGSAGTVLATMGFTDDAGATTQSGATCSLSSADRQATSFTVEMDGSSNLTYATTVSGATGSPQYSLRVVVERMTDGSPSS